MLKLIFPLLKRSIVCAGTEFRGRRGCSLGF